MSGCHIRPAENESKIAKHGISLQQSENFDYTTAFYDRDDAQDYGEVRYLATGWLNALLYTLTFVQNAGSMRAVSLRKATPQERKTYSEET